MRAMSRSLIALTAIILLAPATVVFGRSEVASQQDNPERIAELARYAVTGEWEEQQAARTELQEQFGAFAVNGLLRWIDRDSELDQRVNAIYAMRRLGDEAVLAMLAAFQHSDPVVRRNLCQVLAAIGDPRAVPTLAAAAQNDGDDLVKQEAARALAKLGAAPGNPAQMLADQARRFLSGSGADDGASRVFYWQGRGVAHRELPEGMEPFAYALLFAEQAMRVDPANAEAQKAYVEAVNGLRKIAAEAEDPEWAGEAAQLELLAHLGGAGPEPEAMEAFDPTTVEGAPGTLESKDKRLRYNKALVDYRSGSPAVVEALGQALAESAVRHVVVVDPDPAALNSQLAQLNRTGMYAVGASTAATGLSRAKDSPKDAIVVSSKIRDLSIELFLNSLRRDYRTESVPVIVTAGEADMERLQGELGDKVIAVVPTPVTWPVIKPALDSAFDQVTLNEQRLNAETVSRQAAHALASLAGSSLAPAADALVAAIGREDPVQVPALYALGKLGPEAAQGPAARLLTQPDASLEARVAAAQALAGVLEKHAATSDTLAALKGALRGESRALRNAAARALGKAKSLSVAERTDLLLDNSFSLSPDTYLDEEPAADDTGGDEEMDDEEAEEEDEEEDY